MHLFLKVLGEYIISTYFSNPIVVLANQNLARPKHWTRYVHYSSFPFAIQCFVFYIWVHRSWLTSSVYIVHCTGVEFDSRCFQL